MRIYKSRSSKLYGIVVQAWGQMLVVVSVDTANVARLFPIKNREKPTVSKRLSQQVTCYTSSLVTPVLHSTCS
jgi:hypothetical protein